MKKLRTGIIMTLGLVAALASAACSSGGGSPAPGSETGPGGPGGPGDHNSPGAPGGPSPSSTSPGGPTSGPDKKPYGAQCSKSADCKSDFCVFLSGGSSLGMCTQTCEDDVDCPGLDNKCVALSDAPQKVCVPK